jgi:uncharacterized protein YecE (DUF72 family)
MNEAAAVHIGTSGWHYRHWRGPFYPEKLPASKMLGHYAERLDTVELNSSFYRLPLESGLQTWRETTPERFCFSVKGSRFLTHMKKLKDPEPGLAKFFERVNLLKPKLGPVVFQLPPWWEANPERLESFLDALPAGGRYAFELRNETWRNAQIYRILSRRNAAFCIFEIAGVFSGLEVTADFTYVRLHGPGGAYQGSYSQEALSGWARTIREWSSRLKAIYVYFDNDQAAYAVGNALTLKSLLA